MAAAAIHAQDAGTMYIVPINSDGTATKLEKGDYEGQTVMTTVEGETGVSVKNMALDHGFIFLAKSNDPTKGDVFYTLKSGEAPVFGESNPLSITGDNFARYIHVEEGKYDITFLRGTESGGHNSFTIAHSTVISGIDNVIAQDSPVTSEYYDLAGHHLTDSPTQPGIYIVVTQGQAYKIIR